MAGPESYRIRDVTLFGSPRRVLMQSSNGPCPLLAACNVLLLRNQLRLPRVPSVSFEELTQLLSNLVLDLNSREKDEVRAANIEQSVMSCIDVLPALNVGLDVNCRFTGPRDFEYTHALCLFDLLDISLLHGWVVAPEDAEAARVIGMSTYNALTERLVRCEEAREGDLSEEDGDRQSLLEEGAIIRGFLERTASQLTYEGLIGLHGALKERELAVLFRNRHFGTLLKHEGSLYLLCTDIGFLDGNSVWERLDDIGGDTAYLGADFQPPGGPRPAPAPVAAPGVGNASQTPAIAEGPPPAPGRTAGGPVRAPCPACRSVNDFDIPGAESQVRCGACTFQFLLQRPPAFATKTCQKCAAVNQFPAPGPGRPPPSVRCGVCGAVG